jgi:hypothetical protein
MTRCVLVGRARLNDNRPPKCATDVAQKRGMIYSTRLERREPKAGRSGAVRFLWPDLVQAPRHGVAVWLGQCARAYEEEEEGREEGGS